MLKVTINPKGPKSNGPYPKLMIDTNKSLIVLFLCDTMGTIISECHFTSDSRVGVYSSKWNMEEFVDYEGSVVLTKTL